MKKNDTIIYNLYHIFLRFSSFFVWHISTFFYRMSSVQSAPSPQLELLRLRDHRTSSTRLTIISSSAAFILKTSCWTISLVISWRSSSVATVGSLKMSLPLKAIKSLTRFFTLMIPLGIRSKPLVKKWISKSLLVVFIVVRTPLFYNLPLRYSLIIAPFTIIVNFIVLFFTFFSFFITAQYLVFILVARIFIKISSTAQRPNELCKSECELEKPSTISFMKLWFYGFDQQGTKIL